MLIKYPLQEESNVLYHYLNSINSANQSKLNEVDTLHCQQPKKSHEFCGFIDIKPKIDYKPAKLLENGKIYIGIGDTIFKSHPYYSHALKISTFHILELVKQGATLEWYDKLFFQNY